MYGDSVKIRNHTLKSITKYWPVYMLMLPGFLYFIIYEYIPMVLLKHLIDIFGSYDGGYIINTSHNIMRETPLDNIITLLESVLEYK